MKIYRISLTEKELKLTADCLAASREQMGPTTFTNSMQTIACRYAQADVQTIIDKLKDHINEKP